MEKTTRELLVELVDKGKNQPEISRRTQVSQATISRILTGKNNSDYAPSHGKILAYYRMVMQSDDAGQAA